MEAFSDPKVKGVTLYLSDFSRPVADKLMNGDIFSGGAPWPKHCLALPITAKIKVLTSFSVLWLYVCISGSLAKISSLMTLPPSTPCCGEKKVC